ncbi:hypothetical protein B0H13DRAFT_1861711 [Mycena leptocephala]|nr:hypothetical protein B0H13DRAFT_1861711 [Mycena leptocephala]
MHGIQDIREKSEHLERWRNLVENSGQWSLDVAYCALEPEGVPAVDLVVCELSIFLLVREGRPQNLRTTKQFVEYRFLVKRVVCLKTPRKCKVPVPGLGIVHSRIGYEETCDYVFGVNIEICLQKNDPGNPGGHICSLLKTAAFRKEERLQSSFRRSRSKQRRRQDRHSASIGCGLCCGKADLTGLMSQGARDDADGEGRNGGLEGLY